MTITNKQKAILAISIATLFWGTTYPTIKFGLTGLHLPPITFLFLRFLISTISMLPLLALKRIRTEVCSSLMKLDIVLLGLFNGIAFSFQFIGQVWAQAGISAIMVNTYVLFTPLFVRILLKKKINIWKRYAIVTGFVGVLVISIGDLLSPKEHPNALTGTLLVLVCGIITGLYVAYSEKIMITSEHSASPISIFFSSTLFTLLILIIELFAFRNFHTLFTLDPGTLLWVGYLGIFCTSGTFILYLYAVREFGAVNIGVFLLAQIIISIVISVYILDEQLNGFMIFGALLIFAAIWLINKSEKR